MAIGRRATWTPALAVALLGCASGGAAVTTTATTPATTTTAVTITTEPVFTIDGPTLEEIPTLEPVERFTIDLDELGLAEVQPVAIVAAGLWYLLNNIAEFVDGTTGKVERVELPISFAQWDEAIVVEGVLWAPAFEPDEGGGSVMLRFDLTTRAFDVYPAPGPMTRLQADTTTIWAERADTDEPAVAGWGADGLIGDELVVAGASESGALEAILVPRRDGVYDCLYGVWGYTPVGGTRSAVDVEGTACNAVPVDDGVVIVAGGVRLLRGGSAEVINGVDGFDATGPCDGPAQTGTRIVVLCGVGGPAPAVVEIDLATATATVTGAAPSPDPVLQPELDLDFRVIPHALWSSGRFGAIQVGRELDTVGAVLGKVTAPGTVEWVYLDLDAISASADLRLYGDTFWVRRWVGEPGQQKYTWYEVVDPA